MASPARYFAPLLFRKIWFESAMPKKPRCKRAFIIYGRGGYPTEAWQPWLKRELSRRGYRVTLPTMPNADHPDMLEWLHLISKLVGEPDGETVLVGHSLGGQAVLRYLEIVGAMGKAVGATVIIAGSLPPELSIAEARKKVKGDNVLLPWFTLGVEAPKVKAAAGRCTVILSEDDPYIPVRQAVAAFRKQLNPTIVMKSGQGHFNEDDGLTELPEALEAIIHGRP
jgi:predicted alpha/beta hydrolase family esterase